MKINKLNTINY